MTDGLITNNMVTRRCDARTILRQIGPMTLMACGARNYVDLGDGVHFNVLTGRSHKIVVKLAANDTYTVERVRLRNYTVESVEHATDVYCDQLSDVVYHMVNK